MGACGSKEVIDDPTSPTIAASADCHTPRSHLRRSVEDPKQHRLSSHHSSQLEAKFGHNGPKQSPEPVSRSGLQREPSVRELDPNRPAATQLTWLHPSNSQSSGLGRETIGVSPLSFTNTNSNTSGVPLSARGSSSITTTPRVSKDRDVHVQALALALGNSVVAAGKQQFITPNSARESNSRPGTPGDKKDLFTSLDGKSQPATARSQAELVNITFSPTYEGEPNQSPHVVPSIVQPGATYPVPSVLLQSQVNSSPTSQNSIIPPPPSNSVPLSSIPSSMGMPTLVRSRSSSPSPMTPTRRAKLGLRGSEGSIYAPSTRTLPQSSNVAPELAQFQADLNGAQITHFNTSELQSATTSVHGSPTDASGRSRGLRIDLDVLPGSVRTETPSPSRVPAHLNVAAFKKAYASAYAKIQAKNAARDMREKELAAAGSGELVKPFVLSSLGVLGPRHSRPGSNNNSPRQSVVTLQNVNNGPNVASNADNGVKVDAQQQQFSLGVLGEPRPSSRPGLTASQSTTAASSTNVSAPASNTSAPSTAAVFVPAASEERIVSAAVTAVTSVAGSPVPGSSSPFLSASSKAFFDSAALAPYMTPSNILNEDMPHFHEAYKQWFREEIARERAERKQRPANHSPSRSLFSTPRHRPEMDGNGNPLDSSDLESMPIVGDRIPVGNFDTSGMPHHPNAVYDGSGAQTPTTPGGGPMTLFGLLRESNSRAGSGANTPLGSQPPSLAQGLIASGFVSVGTPGSGSPVIRSSPVMRNSSLLGSSHRRAGDSPSHGRHYTPIHLPSAAAAAAATSNNTTTYQHPLALYSDSSGLIT